MTTTHMLHLVVVVVGVDVVVKVNVVVDAVCCSYGSATCANFYSSACQICPFYLTLRRHTVPLCTACCDAWLPPHLQEQQVQHNIPLSDSYSYPEEQNLYRLIHLQYYTHQGIL